MSSLESSLSKKIYGSTSDFISNLPDAIIENILTRVPLRDAVRTSVLSKRWTYAWVTIQDLVFDNTLCKLSQQHQLVLQYKILLIVYQVLHRIQTVRIEEFSLHISLGKPHRLPISLFSNQKLSHLSLHNCVFSPPANFRGFTMLVSLELVEVNITEESLVTLISSCALLENLEFETYLDTIFVHIEIDSPSLKIMRFIGTFKYICFKNAPNLATVTLRSKELVSQVEQIKGDLFYCKLPALENLELDRHYIKSLSEGIFNVGGKIEFRAPRYLKNLKLDYVNLDIPLECCLALLLMLSQNMQILRIKLTSSGNDTHGWILGHRGLKKLYFEQLRDVHVDCVLGTKTEIRFLKYILTRSRVLEKMVIKPHSAVLDKGFTILKELSCCERLSLKAKIIL